MSKKFIIAYQYTPYYPKLNNNGLKLENEFKQKVKYFEKLPLTNKVNHGK